MAKRGGLLVPATVVAVIGVFCVAHASDYVPTQPKPAHMHMPYRPATDRERLEHDLKHAQDCQNVCPEPSHQESDGGWIVG